MKKRLIIAFALLVLFSTYKPQQLSFTNKFYIEEIKIENNLIVSSNKIKKNLFFLYETNLINLNYDEIESKLKKLDFIEGYEIKKIYPKKLIIKIFEKQPIAVLHHKKAKFYLSENIELINYIDLEDYNNLPTVFGDRESFKELYHKLKKINFPLDLVKNFYLYESKRWDIQTNKEILIKLPSKEYIKSLKNFLNLKKDNNFDKYKIFDYRINNQLILK